jgi:hypothetical protein
LSGESGFHQGVEGVLRKISLSRLTSWVSDWHGDRGIFAWGLDVTVEEESRDSPLEDVIGGEGGTGSILSVVSCDSSKVWDGFLVSVNDKVLVDGEVNDSSDLGLNLFYNEWDYGGFEKWDEDGGNLGYKGSGKGDVEVI